MDLSQLKTFVDVHRAGGFAPVAKDRGVSPSSISRAIASLERSLEVRLFQRTTRRLSPTEAGDAFLNRVLPLIEEMESACAEASEGTKHPSGRLRVTASVSFGQMCIVPRLKAFRTAYPDIDMDLILSDAQIDLLAERIDLAVRHGPLSDSGMIARKLTDVRYRLVTSPDYLLNAPSIKHPDEVSQHPCIAFSYEGFRTRWQFRQTGQRREITIAPAITVSNAMAIRQCARDGLGLALLADWTIERDLETGQLVELLPNWQAAGASFDSSIWLVFPSRRFIPAKTRAFADFLAHQR